VLDPEHIGYYFAKFNNGKRSVYLIKPVKKTNQISY